MKSKEYVTISYLQSLASVLVVVTTLLLPLAVPRHTDAGELSYTIVVPENIGDACGMWLDPDKAKQFLAYEVHIEPRVGSFYEVAFEPETDRVGACAGTYTSRIHEFNAPNSLVFEWNYLAQNLVFNA